MYQLHFLCAPRHSLEKDSPISLSVAVHTKNEAGTLAGASVILGRMRALLSLLLLSASYVHADQADWLVMNVSTKHKGDAVSFAATFTNWEEIKMSEVVPGQYTVALPMPWVPIFSYKFIVNGKWISDPKNKHTESDGFGGQNSLFVTNFKEDELLEPPTNSTLHERRIQIKDYRGENREIIILRPTQKTAGPIFFFHDGLDYYNHARVGHFVENLYRQQKINITAVLIPPNDRMVEYGSPKENDFDKFVREKVVPAVHAESGVPSRPELRVVIGASLGGNAALRQGLSDPTFGYVVSQSGAFWYWGEDWQNIIKERRATPTILIENGIYEGYGITDSNTKLESLLRSERMTYVRNEVPTGHNWLSWRNRLDTIVEWYLKNSRQNSF